MSANADDDSRIRGRRKSPRNAAPSFPKDEPQRPAPAAPATFSKVEGQILSVCLRSNRDPRDIGILPALLWVERRGRRNRTAL